MLNLKCAKYELHEDGIGFINLNNSPVNALSKQFVSDLASIIDHIENDNKCRLIIFRSLQKHFSAGADLKERKNMTSDQTITFINEVNSIFDRIENLSIPTIASINGAALGGGLELALCCDLRIASENSYVGLPETSLGIIPGAGGLYRLAKLIGLPKSKYWIFTAQKFNAESAYGDGVIDFMSKDEELLGVTLEISQEILENAPLAIKASKTLFNEIFKDANDLRELQNKAYSSVIDTEDKKEAIKAFLSKRKPSWKGK